MDFASDNSSGASDRVLAALVAANAEQNGFFYGLFAVIVSVSMGWIAGRLFALV